MPTCLHGKMNGLRSFLRYSTALVILLKFLLSECVAAIFSLCYRYQKANNISQTWPIKQGNVIHRLHVLGVVWITVGSKVLLVMVILNHPVCVILSIKYSA